MIKRYLLIAEKDNKEWYQVFQSMTSAENEQLVCIRDGYKTKIVPLNLDLFYNEIQEHYEKEIENVNIFNDFISILRSKYNVPEDDFDIIERDIDIIFETFKKVEDSELSHWENIEKTIDYLKDYNDTKYNYSSIN